MTEDYEIGSMRDMEHDIRHLIEMLEHLIGYNRIPQYIEDIKKYKKKYDKLVKEWDE